MDELQKRQRLIEMLNAAAVHLAHGIEYAAEHKIKVNGLAGSAEALAVALDELADSVEALRQPKS